MTTADQFLRDPSARRWTIVCVVVAAAHILVFTLLAPSARLGRFAAMAEREIAPIFLDLTPRARPVLTPPTEAGQAGPAIRSDLAPILVRPAAPTARPSDVAPLVIETPPPQVRPTAPGRVIPQSWRDRCGLGAGAVSDADYAACRDGFLQAASPGDRRPLGRQGDPSQDFAAQGAANIARYEYFRSPTPTGGGLSGPSSAPGSNFGMGSMTEDLIYTAGSRPDGPGQDEE